MTCPNCGYDPRPGEVRKGHWRILEDPFMIFWRGWPLPLPLARLRLLSALIRNEWLAVDDAVDITILNQVNTGLFEVQLSRLRRTLREAAIPVSIERSRRRLFLIDE